MVPEIGGVTALVTGGALTVSVAVGTEAFTVTA